MNNFLAYGLLLAGVLIGGAKCGDISAIPSAASAPGPSQSGGSSVYTNGDALCAPEHQAMLTTPPKYSYLDSGLSWDDDPSWVCTSGQNQSPINIPARSEYAPGLGVNNTLRVQVGTASGKNMVGLVLPSLELVLKGSFNISGFQVPVCNRNGTPPDVGCLSSSGRTKPTFFNVTVVNVHFHIPSEHSLEGVTYPLEGHMVTVIPNTTLSTCPSSGCIVVFGVFFKYGNDTATNAFLQQLTPALQSRGAHCTPLGDMNITSMFPSNRSYTIYRGSLTTPPCTEGTTFIMFNTPVLISSRQARAFKNTFASVRYAGNTGMRTNNRPIQMLNNRTIMYAVDNFQSGAAGV